MIELDDLEFERAAFESRGIADRANIDERARQERADEVDVDRESAADLKIFLTAAPEERARRRYKQLKEKGIDVSLPDLSWDIAQRDARDANRTVAPLKPAPDARVIDSTSLTPKEVVTRILQWLEEARA